ncbi:spectrin beta chain, erythrocytic [Pelobates cultripes]|uniref:Threonylcarbamoyl-AMP synthase n=1 Tax=Pelobates cultripes TaxID=61616 RepID=A0AAD1T136_PELCU|nr:spectrin beta chain, erythrocytic [Pelobates cultripes]
MEGFPAVFYSEPAVLGLLANAVSAFLVCMQNFALFHTSILPTGAENILAGVHLILIGGIAQLIAGFLSFRKYDHLSGTSFIAFSALWSSYGATRILVGSEAIPQNSSIVPTLPPLPINESAVAGLVSYIVIAVILSFCSATVNYIMPFVFGALTMTLIFEAVGLFGRWALVVSGVLELIIVVCGLYGGAALLLKGITQRYVLPGFGNSLFNVLLLGSGNSGSSKTAGEEKKKNTKYAEPMALGYLCDTISPFIMAFYCFGYIKIFYVAAIWISINVLSQLCSSYYSYLRDDIYYATKFAFHGIFWLVKSWEEFTITVVLEPNNVTIRREVMVGDWFFLVAACVLCFLSLNKDILELIHNISFALITVSTIQQIPSKPAYIFFGVTCGIFTVISLYSTFASLVNTIAEKVLIPIGNIVVSSTKLQDVLLFGRRHLRKSTEELIITENVSSRFSDPLFYVCNGLASIAAIQSSLNYSAEEYLSIPWVLIPGTIIQLYVSRIDVQRGRRFGSVLPFCYSAIWATWVWLRFAGPTLGLTANTDGGFTVGAIAFLIINIFLIIIAIQANVILFIVTLLMEAVLVSFLLFTLGRLPLPLEITVLSLYGIVCAYGFLASLANCIFNKELIPMGRAIFKKQESKKNDVTSDSSCILPQSRRTSGLRTIAKILENGGVCGIPTDTVYALAASCKHPDAINRIYTIKERPTEKPICICISNLDQLRVINPPFNPLLWRFMDLVYPGGISCIVQKGEWLKKLGVGPAYDQVGTSNSIMIRVPDHSVTAHLTDMTGPLAITSANPSGESDSTHHDMVITRLSDKLDAILCDGYSNELVGSTVVNCTKIDEGTITILREGCVPSAKIMQLFEKAKNTQEVL